MADLNQVETLANELFEKHNLTDWEFGFDKAKVRFGVCNYKLKKITLSKALVELNSLEEAKDTILHEIAHALCSAKDGHGIVWQAKCLEIGAKPRQYRNSSDLNMAKGKYTYKCPNCGKESYFHRELKRERACGKCCREFNYGVYSDKYKLELMKG